MQALQNNFDKYLKAKTNCSLLVKTPTKAKNLIKIDGPLAFVWAPYNFFYKGKFSHCGVDCFAMVRMNGSWKIQYIIDTRRKNACKY